MQDRKLLVLNCLKCYPSAVCNIAWSLPYSVYMFVELTLTSLTTTYLRMNVISEINIEADHADINLESCCKRKQHVYAPAPYAAKLAIIRGSKEAPASFS